MSTLPEYAQVTEAEYATAEKTIQQIVAIMTECGHALTA